MKRSSADVIVLADADVWVEDVGEIVDGVANGAPWGMPHRSTWRLTEEATKAVLAGGPIGGELEQPNYKAHPGGGVTVIRRETYEQIPLDPRFVGWGHEDDAWALALSVLLGPQLQGHRRLYHLWHPPQERLYRSLGSHENEALFNRYHAARSPEAMTALLNEFRMESDGAHADARNLSYHDSDAD